jgi:hypothetical protein
MKLRRSIFSYNVDVNIDYNVDVNIDPPPPSDMGNLGRFWLSCLGPVGFQLRKTFKILVQLLALGVIDECYSRNTLWALN